MHAAQQVAAEYLDQKAREGPLVPAQPSAPRPDVTIRLSLDEAAAAKAMLFDRAEEFGREREVMNLRHAAIVAVVGTRLAYAVTRARLFGGEVLLFVSGTEFTHAQNALARLPQVVEKMTRAASVWAA